VGNSEEFYVGPDAIGALPIECDAQTGEPLRAGRDWQRVTRFKEREGATGDVVVPRVRRQAAWFRVFRVDARHPIGAAIESDDRKVLRIEWTVHLANKKAAWYEPNGNRGDDLYPGNSYRQPDPRDAVLRHAWITGCDRSSLVLDAGSRRVPQFGEGTAPLVAPLPVGWHHEHLPGNDGQGDSILLGEARMTPSRGLLVLGGHGVVHRMRARSSDVSPVVFDDIADGAITCHLTLRDGRTETLRAWCLVGPPAFAPQVVNVVTLDDVMEDVGVRHFGSNEALFSLGRFRRGFRANYERDIRPTLDRPAAYRWVAPLPGMNSASPPPFDPRSIDAGTLGLRRALFNLYRRPGRDGVVSPEHDRIFSTRRTTKGLPLLPSLPGDAPYLSKPMQMQMLSLTQTQHFLLRQWSRDQFDDVPPPPEPLAMAWTRANVGNCVGGPFAPGVEVSWNLRNRAIYEASHRILLRCKCVRRKTMRPCGGECLMAQPVSHDRDETAGGGCEPGDLTKRMEVPWQRDLAMCRTMAVRFTGDLQGHRERGEIIPETPHFSTYWWPAQIPVVVLQRLVETADSDGQVNFVWTGTDSETNWPLLGFVVNQVRGANAARFPYFAEQERVSPQAPLPVEPDDDDPIPSPP
jgi:L-lysine 6-oxidase